MNPVVPIGSPASDPRLKSYQDLKARVHTDLLNRLNLERLTQMGQKEAEPEIRRMILEIIERSNETTPLSSTERETLVVDVLNELFGLGPLEALLRDQDISDILVNRFDQVYVERDGRLELTDILFRDDRHLMGDSARAVFFAPRSAAAHNTRGTLLAAAGLEVEARREFEKALALDPNAGFARANLCRVGGC